MAGARALNDGVGPSRNLWYTHGREVVVLLLLLWSGACRPACDCDEDTVPEPVVDTAPLVDPETDAPVPVVDATCPATAWIGLAPTGDCEQLLPGEGWTTWPLLLGPEDPGVDRTLYWLELPPELRGLCVYEHPDPAVQPPAGSSLDPDCGVVAALASSEEVASALLPSLRASLRAGAGGPVAVPEVGDPVRVVVIDTQVDVEPSAVASASDQARHGCAMRAMVQDLTCEGSCPAEVGSLVALDRVAGDPATIDRVHGGFYGTQGTLARRIVDAVADWTRDGRPGHLMLHLAVGWEARHSAPSGAPGALSLPSLAVRLALEHAACAGALAVAAAGNETGGGPSTGPMYPAAWEDRPLPARCAGQAGASGYAPIVHAVDAIGPDGSLVLRARDRGTPRLVAWGFSAMSDQATWAPGCERGGAPLTAMTGSSVATAVTVAAAAAAWRVRPELRGAEVMDLVYGSGTTPAGTPPEGGWSSAFGLVPGRAVRQVSVCAALKAACDGLGGGAPSGCAGACPDPLPFGWSVDVSPEETLDGTPLTLREPDDCGSGPCAHDVLTNGFLVPWAVAPQPSNDGCTECWLGVRASRPTLHLVINPELRGPLYDARVVWFDQGGARLGVHDLSAIPRGAGHLGDGLAPGAVVDVVDLQGIPASATRGRLDLRLRHGDEDHSTTSEVPILR